MISLVALATDDLVLLTSSGELFRLGRDGAFGLVTRLPRGQYNRTHMVAAPDRTGFLQAGFYAREGFPEPAAGGAKAPRHGSQARRTPWRPSLTINGPCVRTTHR